MLHASFSQLNLETGQYSVKPESMANDDGNRNLERNGSVSNEMAHGYEPENFDHMVPSLRTTKTRFYHKTSASGTSPAKVLLRSTPTRQSSVNCMNPMSNIDQPHENAAVFSQTLREKLETLKGLCKDRNGDLPSPMSTAQTSNSSSLAGGDSLISAELRRLCSGSGSAWSAFKSDSDNSSCLFANTSFMSSADFTDDVFPDTNEPKSMQSPSKSELLHDSLIQDVSIECFEEEQPQVQVMRGAALIGSPSKVRHQGLRSVRRVKSASSLRSSVRYSPFSSSPRKTSQLHSPSGRRWYKAKTDPCLDEIQARRSLDFENDVALPKRVLRFDEPDSQTCPAPVEKLLPQIARTDTPESGYGSLNSTQQTPELARDFTPVSSFKRPLKLQGSSVPFPVPGIYTPRSVSWLERFDVISRLYKIEPSLVDHILSYLEPKDLVLFSSVSIQWKAVCSSLPKYASIRASFLEEQRHSFIKKKENQQSALRLERCMTRPGTPLSSVQHLGKPTAESTPVRPVSTFEKFHMAGKQLPAGHSLGKCKCGSPARVEATTSKALCSSVHCQLEFCFKCRMGYHGDGPCSPYPGRGRPRGPSVGSRKSKKNLRRHSRLSSTNF